MNGIEFVRTMVSEFHTSIVNDVKDLTPEHLSWKPAPGANPIGFLFWHYMRTEDNIVQGLLKKPSVWEAEKWHEKLGMKASDQGTGFKEPDVDEAAALPLSIVLEYAERVITATDNYLLSIDDDGLDYALDPEKPHRNVGMMIRNFILAHGWWHLGEIKYLKGMQGMPFPR